MAKTTDYKIKLKHIRYYDGLTSLLSKLESEREKFVNLVAKAFNFSSEEVVEKFKTLSSNMHDSTVKNFDLNYELPTNISQYCETASNLLKTLKIELKEDSEQENIDEKIDSKLPSEHLENQEPTDETLSQNAKRWDGISFIINTINKNLTDYIESKAQRLELSPEHIRVVFESVTFDFHENIIKKVDNDEKLEITEDFPACCRYAERLVFGLGEDNKDLQEAYEDCKSKMRESMQQKLSTLYSSSPISQEVTTCVVVGSSVIVYPVEAYTKVHTEVLGKIQDDCN